MFYIALIVSMAVVSMADGEVAQINDGNKYPSLALAVDAAVDGDVVTVIESHDATCSNAWVTVDDKDITIDLNGKVISVSITEGVSKDRLLKVVSGANLTLVDSSESKTGIINVNAPDGLYNLLYADDSSYMLIKGGSYILNNGEYEGALVYSGGNEKVTIEDGTFSLGNVGTMSNGCPWLINASGQNTRHIFVNGGTFNSDIVHQHYPFEVSVPKERALRNNGDGTYTMVDAVAYVDEYEKSGNWYHNPVGYATFEEAVAAANKYIGNVANAGATNTITLLQNCTVEKSMTINGDITIVGSGTVTGETGSDPMLSVAAGKTLTIKGGRYLGTLSEGDGTIVIDPEQNAVLGFVQDIDDMIAPGANGIEVTLYSEGAAIETQLVTSGIYTPPTDGIDIPDGKYLKAWAIGSEDGEQKLTNILEDGQPETIELTEDTVIYAVWEDIPSGSMVPSGGSGIILEGPFIYKTEYDTMFNETEVKLAKDAFEYGEPVYYLLIDETIGGVLFDYEQVEKLRTKATWNMGESAVEGVKVVKKYINTDEINTLSKFLSDYGWDSGYYYFLEIATADKKGVAETDVAGVIEFNRKSDSKGDWHMDKIKDCKVDVDFTLFYPNTWLTDGQIEGDRADLEWETPYALKFNNDDEVELSFGSANGGNNEGTFTVDVSGQGKVFLEYTTEADEAIAAANEGAKLYFITFNGVNGVGVKFNRTGEFRYEMDDAAYAYEVVDGKLAPIAGLEVEDDEFVFNTNVLKAYVFSDTELNQPA